MDPTKRHIRNGICLFSFLLLLTSCGYMYNGKGGSLVSVPYETSVCYRQALRSLELHDYSGAQDQMEKAMLLNARRLKHEKELRTDAEILRNITTAAAFAHVAETQRADSMTAIAMGRLRSLTAEIPLVDRKTGSVEHQIAGHPLYFPALGLSLIMLIALLLHYRKVDNYTSALSSSTTEIGNLNNEIDNIKNKISGYQAEVDRLNERISRIQTTTNERLGKGQQIFDRLKDGGTMKNISIEDEQSFIDYYAFSHPEEFSRLTSSYTSLSLRHTTYLILCEMGFDDKTIQEILFVRDSTIRNYRLRMNRNRK